MSLFFSGKEIVEIALRIENNGKAFYQEAIRHLKDPAVKAAYEHLATEEMRHATEFQALLRSLAQAQVGTPSPEYQDYLRVLVDSRLFTDEAGARERALNVQGDLEAVDVGMGMEKDTILFFAEIRELVHQEDLPVVERILAEEREHLKRLAVLKTELLKLRERRA